MTLKFGGLIETAMIYGFIEQPKNASWHFMAESINRQHSIH